MALPSGDLQAVINLQGNLPAKMLRIPRIVPKDRNGLSVDKAVKLQRHAQTGDLPQSLLHLALSQRIVVQPVNAAVVLEKDVRPVPDELLLRRVAQDFLFPAMFCQQIDKRNLEIGFFIKCHGVPLSALDKHFFKAGFLDILQTFQFTLMKGAKVIEVFKEGTNFPLLTLNAALHF